MLIDTSAGLLFNDNFDTLSKSGMQKAENAARKMIEACSELSFDEALAASELVRIKLNRQVGTVLSERLIRQEFLK